MSTGFAPERTGDDIYDLAHEMMASFLVFAGLVQEDLKAASSEMSWPSRLKALRNACESTTAAVSVIEALRDEGKTIAVLGEAATSIFWQAHEIATDSLGHILEARGNHLVKTLLVAERAAEVAACVVAVCDPRMDEYHSMLFGVVKLTSGCAAIAAMFAMFCHRDDLFFAAKANEIMCRLFEAIKTSRRHPGFILGKFDD